MPDPAPLSIAFILTPDYALMSLTSAVEPLRAANQLAQKTLYHCSFHSVGGGFLASTAGGGFFTESLAQLRGTPDLVFVVAGGNPMLYKDAALEQALRGLALRGARLGGISGGAAILAKAGFMAGHRFTLHWAHIDPLREYNPDLLIERALYVIDRNRYSCAGGVAAMDMMGALIAREQGADFARAVSDWFIHPRLRQADEPQQPSPAQRFDLHHPGLAAAIGLMETHLADPLAPEQLAGLAGCSRRQLQRLFSQHFGQAMMQVYRDLRLAKADELLAQTALPLVEIAMMTGFADLAHFNRCFRARYGQPPARRRRALTAPPPR